MDGIIQIERDFLLWMQETIRADWLSSLMKGITLLSEYGAFWILLCLGLIIYRRTRRIGIICAMSLALTFICCNIIIKPLVDRLRPWEAYPALLPLLEDPGDASFPSGHTASAMGTAWAMYLSSSEDRTIHKWSCFAVALALLIGFSRIYLGMHYPTDVIGAMVLGAACAGVVYIAVRKYGDAEKMKELPKK